MTPLGTGGDPRGKKLRRKTSRRTFAIAAAGFLAFAALLVLTFGAILIVTPAIAFALWPRARGWVMSVDEPGRMRLAATALLVWIAGFVLFEVLVFDDNDNAYLFVALLGLMLVPVGLAFAISAALPGSWRRRSAPIAIGLLWGAGSFGALVLVYALVVIPSQDYPDNDVFRSHALSLGVMAALLVAAFVLHRGWSHSCLPPPPPLCSSIRSCRRQGRDQVGPRGRREILDSRVHRSRRVSRVVDGG